MSVQRQVLHGASCHADHGCSDHGVSGAVQFRGLRCVNATPVPLFVMAAGLQSVPAPTGANDVAAIAAAVEKLLGDKAGATVATRGQGMHPTPVPPPPPPPLHPVQQGSSALSSFLHSAAVLQQSLPGNDIMSLLQSALGGTAEHECYSGPPTPHTQQPLPLSARGMPGGMRAAHTPGCMRGTMPRPQVWPHPD